MRLPNPAQSATEISEKLDDLFARVEFAQLAKDHELIIRQRKVTGENFLRLCVLSENLTSTSLDQLGEDFPGGSISKQSLSERFNPFAVKFLERVVWLLLQKKLGSIVAPAGVWELSAVTIADSTCIMLPDCMRELFPGFGAKGSWAGLKIFYEYDLRQGIVRNLNIYPASENDYQSGEMILQQLHPKELVMRDLGFYKLDFFARIAQGGAYFLSRYKTGTNLYPDVQGKEPINLQRLIKKIPAGQSKELLVYAGNKQRLPCRLIIDKFDSTTAAERRRKLRKGKKGKGKNLSRKRLELCSCNCYLVNLPQDSFPLTDIQKIYSIRWQIEIMFKIWKSVFNIDKIKAVDPNRILCFIYGKLIAILLCTTIFWPIRNACEKAGKYLSELKSFRKLMSHIDRIVQHLIAKTPVIDTIKFFIQLLWQKAEKEKKKGKTSVIDCFKLCLNFV
jgi:hypothetical protein